MAFISSLALHLLLVLYFSQVESQKIVSDQDTPLEIVFQNQKKKNVFVQAPNQPEEQKIKPKNEVKLKSDQTRRVELETFKRPDFLPDIQANLESGGNKGSAKKQETKKEVAKADSWYKTEDEQRKPLELPGFGSTSSRPMIPAYVQQQLPPGVRLGNVTALNTDQSRFYSFNQRLLSRFIPLWGSRVRSALYKWLQDNPPPSISKSWVTNVEVIMDSTGEILDVQPFRLSGLWDIDNASLDSFKQVKNVPNPPKEMVDENGYIHLQFQTEVIWVPQPGVRFHGGN